MAKPKVTRTFGPIHFEDLDPHRFEDLLREIIYDYKDWQTIEATGRSGNDSGFDIRAYEKAEITSETEGENGEEIEEVHPMEGNMWMIQVKREKEIGPKKLKSILSEIDPKNPPYGYILAASTNFSKDSYDVFRTELREKGVMEFYLWGKAEMEDMLHLPKNDRILFTFFGISLVSRRRSRATDIRSAVSVKNKLLRCVGAGQKFHTSVLIRDLKDTHYPFESEYNDFEKRPRWREYIAFSHYPIGLFCHSHEYFAYVDTVRKEWDYAREADLVFRQSDRENAHGKAALVRNVWEFFPRSKQGYFVIDSLVKYSDIVIVDDKGDVWNNFPHLFVDFIGEGGPFAGSRQFLKIGEEEVGYIGNYKRIRVFPKSFAEEPKVGVIHKEKSLALDLQSVKDFQEFHLDTLYETDGRYSFLEPRDVILIAQAGQGSQEEFIQVTHKFKTTVKEHLEATGRLYKVQTAINRQLGREADGDEEINVYEFRRFYEWQIDQQCVCSR